MFMLQRISDGAYYRTPKSVHAQYGTTMDATRATTWFETKIPTRIRGRFEDNGSYWRVVPAPPIMTGSAVRA